MPRPGWTQEDVDRLGKKLEMRVCWVTDKQVGIGLPALARDFFDDGRNLWIASEVHPQENRLVFVVTNRERHANLAAPTRPKTLAGRPNPYAMLGALRRELLRLSKVDPLGYEWDEQCYKGHWNLQDDLRDLAEAVTFGLRSKSTSEAVRAIYAYK